MARRDDQDDDFYDDEDDRPRRRRRQPASGGSNVLLIVGIVVGVALLGCGGVALALILPGISKVRGAAERAQVANHMKQIGIALHNYHDMTGSLPAWATTGKDKEPLLSWRVALLPFIEQDMLYRRISQAEAWDGPMNGAVTTTPVPLYFWPKESSNQTFLLGIEGPGATFDRGAKRRPLSEFRDGTSNTMGVAVADAPVPWAKPQDHAFVPNGPLPRFGREVNQPFLGLLMDGSARPIRPTVRPETLRALMTIAGNEVINEDF